jgi:hypothetical protein
MFIDPAGRGKDESAYAVVKQLNGFLFVLASGGLIGGYTPENLQALTNIARDNSAKLVLIESNFGDGMFQQLLTPYLTKTYPVSIEEVRSSKQKEARIADTLEPIMNQHKLVVSRSVIRKDLSDLNMSEGYDCAHQYQLFWQLSRLTREKGSLPHDDRLDALAGAVAHFTSQMSTEADKAILLHRQRVQDLNYQTFMKSVKKQYRPSKPNWIRQR